MTKDYNKIAGLNDDGTIDIQLTESELESLLDILDFSYSAAKVLAEQEIVRGSTLAAKRMQRLSVAAHTLHKLVIENLDIGQPDNDEIN